MIKQQILLPLLTLALDHSLRREGLPSVRRKHKDLLEWCGENIGGGVAYRLGESGIEFYTEFRYRYASYHKV